MGSAGIVARGKRRLVSRWQTSAGGGMTGAAGDLASGWLALGGRRLVALTSVVSRALARRTSWAGGRLRAACVVDRAGALWAARQAGQKCKCGWEAPQNGGT